MLTYSLFKIHGMLLSATSRKGQPDADLHPVHNPEHTPVSNKQEEPDAGLHAVQNPEHALVSNKGAWPARC